MKKIKQNKDIYDIIIENALKDWRFSMNTTTQRELWEVLNIQNQKLIKLVL